MDFNGIIGRIRKKEGGIEIRLHQGFVFDETFDCPVTVIEAEHCSTPIEELVALRGKEIYGYEIKEKRIDLELSWGEDGKSVSIEASEARERHESYDLEEYSVALDTFRRENQSKQKIIRKQNEKFGEIKHMIVHELDNLNRRIEFQPEKKEQYSKALSILSSLKQRIERPNKTE